ncbi:MAG: hypothetical protein K0S43_1457 [Cellulosimicrobium sp.]|jgi:DNA-binding transcriptional regulator LsrR (DeoR family)|nr:hypothetical protein [Cellulosimicrobium sp.]
MGDMTDFSRHELAHVARRYYVDSASKVEIGEELGVSRFKVARMLEQALESGIVTITIDDAGVVDPTLSARLRSHLGLDECLVVQGRDTVSELREDVGAAAAELLTRSLRPGNTLGFAWGRTLTAMTERLTALPPVTVVQLTGAVGSDLSDSPVEVIRRVSLRAGGDAHAIFAPLVVEDAATAATLRRQPDIARALSLFDRVDVAVVAIGSWDPPISQLREVLGRDERDDLTARGVRAEIAGILLTAEGDLVPDFAERCLSISARQLARVPKVIAVAAEHEKAAAVHAVTRSGLVSALVTEQRCAEALLDLPPVARGVGR